MLKLVLLLGFCFIYVTHAEVTDKEVATMVSILKGYESILKGQQELAISHYNVKELPALAHEESTKKTVPGSKSCVLKVLEESKTQIAEAVEKQRIGILKKIQDMIVSVQKREVMPMDYALFTLTIDGPVYQSIGDEIKQLATALKYVEENFKFKIGKC